jgi:thiosulfate/3-mercaptopyruvate sulfurtransferase
VSGPLVSVAWLRERLGEPGLRVVDARFKLGEPGAAEELWREAHIPGAPFIDVDRELAAPPALGVAPGGRHPLPAPEDFEAAARRAGIGPETLVVAYDEAAEGGAARLWWLLRHFGHDAVVVLDGGLRAWREEGGPLRGGPEDVEPGEFSARPREGDTVEAAELAASEAGGVRAGGGGAPPEGARVVLDARTPERYRGEREPIDPIAGRIPGAVNMPFGELAPGGRFLPPEELRARFEAAGAAPGREAAAYCGSGVTACVLVLAAEVACLPPARLYPGSWSEWSGLGLPVARH